MDNYAAAVADYNAGYRAYINQDGEKIFNNAEGQGQYASPRREDEWHALRAYQDEQRKKGVPIVFNYTKAIKDWFPWDTLLDGRLYNFCGDGTWPKIEPIINIITDDGTVVSRFTNFRWREGYPKQVSTEHIKVIGDGFVDLSESPLVYRYPKGGNNEN